ncbi:hypothetical protein, partial [Amycolatopsis cihanbeyliensis]
GRPVAGPADRLRRSPPPGRLRSGQEVWPGRNVGPQARSAAVLFSARIGSTRWRAHARNSASFASLGSTSLRTQ